MAQSVKYLLHQLKCLSYDPKHPSEKQAWQHKPVLSALWSRDRRVSGAHWPASLANQLVTSSQTTTTTNYNNRSNNIYSNGGKHPVSTSDFFGHTCALPQLSVCVSLSLSLPPVCSCQNSPCCSPWKVKLLHNRFLKIFWFLNLVAVSHWRCQSENFLYHNMPISM